MGMYNILLMGSIEVHWKQFLEWLALSTVHAITVYVICLTFAE